jgi:hypothetical protein
MHCKWMKEGNRLSVDSVKGICIVQCSVKSMSGEVFFFLAHVCVVPALLQKTRATDKCACSQT